MVDPQVAALKEAIEELARPYRMRLATLFGSSARGEAGKLSDVNVGGGWPGSGICPCTRTLQ